MLPQSFEEAHQRICHLVENFRQNEKHYLSPTYSEAQARLDFIDEFWISLGWDVRHKVQRNPYEQEVKVERGVQSGTARRRADYAFLAPNYRDVRFYVEAKKPSVDVDNPDDYFQTIRYGWNSRTPLAVLTDFQQFRILDCRYKPDVETVLQRAARKYQYTDYADDEKFAEIYYLFSREAVLKGSLEKFVEAHLPQSAKRAVQRSLFHKGWQNIDESFLRELDEYREELARSFKARNPQLDGAQLTEATQRTLDRLVFMRFLEDKLIEPEPLVEPLGESGSAWSDFVSASHRLDKIYNGIIFKKHPLLDSPGFRADGAVFEEIRDRLAHTSSPYDFNYIPIHILGSIYERFLGRTIVVREGAAHVEEKPEIRKAGGVYYTPEYIVRYIVEDTVGRMVEGRPPKEIRKMRFADISCGSGSFLLGIYDLLLRYHTNWYNQNKKNREAGRRAGCIADEDGRLRLSLRQKSQILLDNIFGVDVDPQAVEVAQLSLYLKLLEDETPASARNYQQSFREALLPPLGRNVVCGNSLVDFDVSDGQLFLDGEEKRLNPMSFHSAFPEIMREGGFDAIAGNPPYGADVPELANVYFRKKYSAAPPTLDTYALFMEGALGLLKTGGRISMIVPTGWYSGPGFSALRRLMASATDPDVFVNLPYDIFEAWVDTTVFVATKRDSPAGWPRQESCRVRLRTFPKRHKIVSQEEFYQDPTEADFTQWFAEGADEYLTYADTDATKLIQKIRERGVPLQSFADVQRGVTPFKLTEEAEHPNSRRAFSGTVRRYRIEHDAIRYLRFDETLAEPKPEKYFTGPRLLLRELISRQFQLQAVKATENFVTNKSMQSILPLAGGLALNYLLGMINSRLMSWYFLKISNVAQRDDFPKIVLKETRQLPIVRLDLDARHDKASHDRMVSLVEQMLEARRQLDTAMTERDQHFYARKCTDLDQKIDHLVYELFGLTEGEIRIIEQK